jgi:ATP-dependent Clp protease ATP-binding subunit ClpB
LSDAAKEILMEQGYDASYGARPMKRAIQRLLLDPLAVKVLDGEFRDGDKILADANEGTITFKKK